MRPLLLLLLVAGLAATQPPDPAYAPLEKAYQAQKAKRYDEAISFFIKAIEAAPKRTDIRQDLAYTLLKTGAVEEARDQFREALRLDPASELLAMEYAFLCNETRQAAEARRTFDRLRRSSNPKIRSTAEQAFQNIDRPLAEGIARWTEALARGGDTFSTHYELARLYEQRDDLERAAQHFEQAWRLQPERKYVLIDLGRAWKSAHPELADAALLAASRGGEPRAAENARELLPNRYPYVYEFRNALNLDPKNAALRRELAYLLLSMDRQPEAEAQFRILTSEAPEDLLSAAQLGFLYLARHDTSSAMPLLERVLHGNDAELANRVRAVLRLPQVSADAKQMAERSIRAGYLKDGVKYLSFAHESDPVDCAVMYKLGWTYNILHEDHQAIRWFDLARRSPDPQISALAGKAYEALRPDFERFRTTAWFFPMFSTRWHDVFSYGQVKTEWRPKAIVRPYLSVRFIGDTRQRLEPWIPQYLSESSVILALGLATRTWNGITLWGEAGQAAGYLTHHLTPDYRGGVSFARGAHRGAWFAETNADGVFVSRFHDDTLVYLQNRAGYTGVVGKLKIDFYANGNIIQDARRESWADFVEAGPGVRFRLAAVRGAPVLSLNFLRGAYTVKPISPLKPNFFDFRVGIWYAITH